MPKKIYQVSICVLLLCLFAMHVKKVQAQEEADNIPLITGTSAVVRDGEEAEVTLQIFNNPGVAAMALNLTYDTKALTLKGIYNTTLTLGSNFVASPSLQYYPYRLAWSNGISGIQHNGVLTTLCFQVNEGAVPGSYEINISYDEGDIYNLSLEPVIFHVSNPIIQVQPSGSFILGDADRNGQIDLNDAYLALKAALSVIPEQDMLHADIDKDGSITLIDVQTILKAALKIITL